MLSGPTSRRLFKGLMRGRSTIFMLHRREDSAVGVHGHSVEFVRTALMELRAGGAQFVSLRTLVDHWRRNEPVDPNWIAFTIDDGFADQVELVRDAFMPLQCPVTIFPICGFLDGELWPWDDQVSFICNHAAARVHAVNLGAKNRNLDLSTTTARESAAHDLRDTLKSLPNADIYRHVAALAEQIGVVIPQQPPAHFRPLSWSTARELEAAGVDFGPHSVTHRIFSQLDAAEIRHEIARSWQRLQEELRNPLPVFAWPTGRPQDFTPECIAIARELGIQAAVSTEPGYAHMTESTPADRMFHIQRFGLPEDLITTLRYGSWLERGRELLPA